MEAAPRSPKQKKEGEEIMKGHIRERGKGRWYVVLDDYSSGNRRRRWVSLPGCRGKREAILAAARLTVEAQDGGAVDPSRLTVGVFIERWLDHMKSQVGARAHE